MSKRVLIINGKTLKRKLIRYVLSKHGYEIVGEIRKGAGAVSLYNECRPDLVAIDISMHQYYREGIMVVFLIDSKDRNVILESSKNQDLNIKVLEPDEVDYTVKLTGEGQFLRVI